MFSFQPSPRSRLLTAILFILVAIPLSPCNKTASTVVAESSVANFDKLEATSSDSNQPVYQGRWRYTRYGWQDLNDWIPPETTEPTALEMIHPVLLAIGLMLIALGALLWCSEEWDAARLLEGPESVCRRRQPRSPCIHDYLPASNAAHHSTTFAGKPESTDDPATPPMA